MPDAVIDLRSDTVTKPTPAMRQAMASAEVGDDVYRDDPTVRKLEERVAALLGKEAALFVPSGTMSNQICIRLHTQPGDELLCDANSHIHIYEAGAPAVLSGVTCNTLPGDYGILDVSHLEGNVRPINEHMVRTRLVVLENTHNRGGGRIYPLKNFEAIHAFTKRHGLALHLDGARLWNAVAATGIKPATWAAHFDTVSVCFSKGLGAPIGSALVGPRDFVTRARFVRKLFGGAMRQVGVLAAAALYALDHHVERLVEDHRNAQTIAEAVADSPGLHLDPPDVQTNIVYLNIDRELGSAESFASTLKARGVLVGATGPQRLRAVTHLDVSSAQAVQAADILRKTAKEAVHAKVGVHPELAK